MKKLYRIGIAIGCFASALIISYQATRTEDVLTPSDVQAWRVTDTLHATSKPPAWKDFGLVVAAASVGTGSWHLWKLLEAEEGEATPGQPPPPSPNTPDTPTPDLPVDATTKIGDRLEELWTLLNQPENRFLIRCLKLRPMLVWGPMGSGKSQFVGFISLLRKLYLDHQIEVADPHAHNKSWPDCFSQWGHEFNYKAIDLRLKAYYDRIKKGNQQPVTSIWDEVTSYAENCTSDLAERFLKSILGDTRKPKEYVILISHNNTLSTLAGGKGGVKTMQTQGLAEVHLESERDALGEIVCSKRGYLSISSQAEAIYLQDWMQPQYLLKLFPELAAKKVRSKENQEPIIEIPKAPQISQISWDYWVSESTEEEINRAIESRRTRLETQWGLGASPETQGLEGDSPESLQEKESPDSSDLAQVQGNPPKEPNNVRKTPTTWDAATFERYFPDTTERELFEQILSYLDKSKNASEIIKNVLRCKKGDPTSPRSYSEVGKPAFKYLVRKYGTAALIAHFADFLDKN